MSEAEDALRRMLAERTAEIEKAKAKLADFREWAQLVSGALNHPGDCECVLCPKLRQIASE